MLDGNSSHHPQTTGAMRSAAGWRAALLLLLPLLLPLPGGGTAPLGKWGRHYPEYESWWKEFAEAVRKGGEGGQATYDSWLRCTVYHHQPIIVKWCLGNKYCILPYINYRI